MNQTLEIATSPSVPAQTEQIAVHQSALRCGICWLAAFLAVQVLLTVVLKAGAMYSEWYWPATVVGSSMTILTTWLLMRVFAFFPPHLAQALAVGLSFVLSQVAVAAMVKVWLTPGQILGTVVVFCGILLLSERAALREGGT
jgi:hypothetical protein